MMRDVYVELSVEDNERSILLRNASMPTTIFSAVVLEHLHRYPFRWHNTPRVAVRLCFRGSRFLPVRQKLILPFISQRMFEQLLEYFERHGGDIGAHARGFNDVNWMTQTRGQHLSFPFVVIVNLDNLLEQP